MRKERLQQMATKYYLESVSIAKARGERLISIDSNESFIKLRRALSLLKKEKIEANFRCFLDFRRKPSIKFSSIV